jgi:hypothetical protein
MRLINAETLELEEFCGNEIPEYAILSHTWETPKEEVSFIDITSKTFKHKAGYQKIWYLCQQASKDHLSWVWCDTCCINKDSSAELSEAINSMFQWYQNAKICYAYLVDILTSSSGKAEENTGKQSKDWVPKEFYTSRWFRRGWTLQELLAPEDVVFFARDWTRIGTKQTLYNHIRTITGVNKGALKWPWTISSYSVATRISWAAGRKTSRPEDRAYSLLGILGVHMPLLYGEAEYAFQRLQTELVKLSDDETLFVHSGPNILAEGPDAFISNSELYSMATALPRSTQDRPYSITNMGLSMEIPLIHLEERDGRDSSRSSRMFGILNCHHVQDYKHYLAIPLQKTSIPGTLLRALGPVRLIEEAYLQKAERTPVLIKLRHAQISKIICLLEHRGFSPSEYEQSLVTLNALVAWQFRVDRVTLLLDPKKEMDYEIAIHQYMGKSDDESFLVSTIFEFSGYNAGLLIFPPLEYEGLRRQGPDAIFNVWEDEGKPTEKELQTTQHSGQIKRVVAKIARETRLNQPIWVLYVEVILN